MYSCYVCHSEKTNEELVLICKCDIPRVSYNTVCLDCAREVRHETVWKCHVCHEKVNVISNKFPKIDSVFCFIYFVKLVVSSCVIIFVDVPIFMLYKYVVSKCYGRVVTRLCAISRDTFGLLLNVNSSFEISYLITIFLLFIIIFCRQHLFDNANKQIFALIILALIEYLYIDLFYHRSSNFRTRFMLVARVMREKSTKNFKKFININTFLFYLFILSACLIRYQLIQQNLFRVCLNQQYFQWIGFVYEFVKICHDSMQWTGNIFGTYFVKENAEENYRFINNIQENENQESFV